MKTQIIRLEPYDDIYSAKDKMGWGQTSRILLVYPLRGRVLNRRLDLIMLKRHCSELGSQLALVVQDAEIRYFAQDLGIPIFSSARKAEKEQWRPDRRQRGVLPKTIKRQSSEMWRLRRIPMNLIGLRDAAHPPTPRWIMHPFTRVLAFTLGVLGVLAVAALLLPSAEIQLTPETLTDRLTISVAASPEYQAVDISGTVPAYPRSVFVEGRGSIPSTGSIPLPDHFATGEVHFTNLTDRSMPLPEGTVVSTLDDDPLRYATKESVMVPPGDEGANVVVEALNPGTTSNTDANTILAIEGPLGLDLTVINEAAIEGGTDRMAPAPSEADYQELYDQLYATLARSALKEIGSTLAPDDLVLNYEATYLSTLEETYTPAEPRPIDQLELVLRLEFQALTVSGRDLQELGTKALEANLPDQYSSDLDSLEIINLTTPDFDPESGRARWRMRTKWQLQAQIDHTKALKSTIGYSPDQAKAHLTENIPQASEVKILLRPAWWPRMPFLPFRIIVTSD